jgi:hypothetical protein
MRASRQALFTAALAGGLTSVAAAQSITTLFAGGNNGSPGGIVFFDLTTGPNALDVTSFDVNTLATAGTNFGFTMYTHTGTYVGTEQNMGAWTVATTGVGTAAGGNAASHVVLNSPVTLQANTTYAIGLVLASAGQPSAQHSYTNGNGSNQNYSNSDLSLQLGAAQNVPFTGAPFTPRVWNGTISYAFNNPNITGACCFNDGSCSFITAASCTSQGGTFRGENVTCAQANCPAPGRCCLFNGTCSVVFESACLAQGGTFTAGGNCAQACPTPPGVVYTNCNLPTGATTLSGVAAPANSLWSEVARDETDPTTANTTSGFGGTGALRLADDFVVGAGGMDLAYIKFPAYLTGSTTVTATAMTVQIWNGRPDDPASQVIFGDPTTNRLANAAFSNIYRCFNTSTPPVCAGALTAPDQTRRIQWLYGSASTHLDPGTYWIDVNYTGCSFSPPATQSDAIGRQCDPNNSNAIQFNVTWVPLNDAGQGCAISPVQQDLYFELLGTTGGGSTCYANCDHSTTVPFLNVLDFNCFLNQFSAGASYANCDGSTIAPVLNVLDFNCFLNRFSQGCSAP